jgi:hypothetical protein
VTGAEPLRAQQAQGEVAVAEPEPVRAPHARERVHDLPGVAPEAPAALVDLVRQPVRDEVRVRGDVHAVDVDVVTRVRDHRELVAGVGQTARELRPTGPSGQQHHRIHCG